jgi:hypothetical protein
LKNRNGGEVVNFLSWFTGAIAGFFLCEPFGWLLMIVIIGLIGGILNGNQLCILLLVFLLMILLPVFFMAFLVCGADHVTSESGYLTDSWGEIARFWGRDY